MPETQAYVLVYEIVPEAVGKLRRQPQFIADYRHSTESIGPQDLMVVGETVGS